MQGDRGAETDSQISSSSGCSGTSPVAQQYTTEARIRFTSAKADDLLCSLNIWMYACRERALGRRSVTLLTMLLPPGGTQWVEAMGSAAGLFCHKP